MKSNFETFAVVGVSEARKMARSKWYKGVLFKGIYRE